MAPLAIIGVLIILTLIGSIFIKSFLEKKKIERARAMVNLTDDLRRMQNAISTLPELYLDKPTKTFIYKSIIQMAERIGQVSNRDDSMVSVINEARTKLDAALELKEDSIKRLSKWCKVANPDDAQEMRQLIKFLHAQTVAAVKAGVIPKAHGARVVKNLKVIAHRIMLDLNYCLGKTYYTGKKHRRALGKFRVALGILHKSPIKQHLNPQKEELEKLIQKTESILEETRKQTASTSANSLASGMDKMEKEEEWEQKKNLYE